MNKVKNFFLSLWNQFDFVLILVAVVVSIMVVVQDQIQSPQGPTLEAISISLQSIWKVTILTLVTLTTVAIYIMRDRRKFLETGQDSLSKGQQAIQEKEKTIEQLILGLQVDSSRDTERIIQAFKAAEIQQFSDEFKCIEYVTLRILDPNTHTIDDTTWSPSERPAAALDVNRKVALRYQEAVREALHTNNLLIYREIYHFNSEHKLEKLKELERENPAGYRCSYYPNRPNVPLLQFMIINGDEVILMTDPHPVYLSIRHEGLVRLFCLYFEDHWKNATSIKTGREFPSGLVDEIIKNWHKKRVRK